MLFNVIQHLDLNIPANNHKPWLWTAAFPFSEFLPWMDCWFMAIILGPFYQFHAWNCVFDWCKLVFNGYLSPFFYRVMHLGIHLFFSMHLFCNSQVPLLRWKRFAVVAAMCIFAVRAVIVQVAFYLHIQVMISFVAVVPFLYVILDTNIWPSNQFGYLKAVPLLVSNFIYLCLFSVWVTSFKIFSNVKFSVSNVLRISHLKVHYCPVLADALADHLSQKASYIQH